MRALPGGDQSALRNLNTRRVLQLLYEGPPLTISAVAAQTGLSRPTAQDILASLTESRLLAPDGFDVMRTGGRPAQRYRFNADAGFLAGVDIGAHAVSARVTTLDGALVASARTAIAGDMGAAERIDTAVDLVRRLVPADDRTLWAAGVGTPGIVDKRGVVRLSVALPHWSGVALAEEVATRLNCPVEAVKDTGAAVLAEHRVGVARDVSDVLYVHVGHRLGVGLLVDGRPFVGRSGAAGEVGRHPAFGWHDAPYRLASDAGLPPGADDLHEWVFARARRSESDAMAAVESFARTVAGGIGAMVLAVDPQLVVIGGGMARAASAILEPVTRHLAAICYDVPPLVLSTLGEDAVTIGAVETARDQLRRRLFDVTP
ncbi:ROK family transcriptional regulator [Actinosynnema sp. NPDC023658]|uniref:ROK family transcriptional regulator n=1 Tax=Actinosynnema sp. NPDC023658 TaxID=3155465 RepID=UPI0033CDB842